MPEYGDDPWYIRTAVSVQPITCAPGLSIHNLFTGHNSSHFRYDTAVLNCDGW